MARSIAAKRLVLIPIVVGALVVLGFMVFISTAADATTLTFYNDRATFDADFPDLPLEDFEEGTVPNARVRGCSSRLLKKEV